MNRHKDRDPRETVELIRSILAELGLSPEGEVHDYAQRFYSLRIIDAATNTGTNGKGASADLARASAYAEYMERLENGMILMPRSYSGSLQLFEGFGSWPYEEVVSFEDAWRAYPEIAKELVSIYVPEGHEDPANPADAKDVDNEAFAFWRNYASDKVSLLPYYCVGSKSSVMLPDTFFAYLCASNGLCSGNTPEEALVEGMGELCERHAKAMILNKELCPPRIPREFIEENCPVQAEMIRTIEESARNIKIIVADASLGQGLPVVCMIFIDQEAGSIRVKFGSHPSFAIALERCMTEHYQGRWNISGDPKESPFTDWDAWSRQSARSLAFARQRIGADIGPVPDRILLRTPDWSFEPWGLSDSFTNKQAMQGLAALLRRIGGEVYIRDNSYLGFPAFHIFVPKVSCSSFSIGPKYFSACELGVYSVCAADAYARGDFRLAADFLKKNCTRRDRCAAQELLCRAEGMPEHDRDVLLEEYFGKGLANYAITVWRSDDAEEALRRFKRRYEKYARLARKQNVNVEERQRARDELARKLNERKRAKPIEQMGIDALFC